MANYWFELGKPTKTDGIIRDITHGYYLKLEQLDVIRIKPGTCRGIPRRWGLIAGNLALDTDANVGDRYIWINTLNKLRMPIGGIRSQKFEANAAGAWDLGPVEYMNGSGIMNGAYTGVGPHGLLIEGEQYHEILIFNAKPGDRWNVSLSYIYLGQGA